jgi:hypothetical protein
MRLFKPAATAPAHGPARLRTGALALALLALALVVALLAPAGAPARSSTSRRHSCPPPAKHHRRTSHAAAGCKKHGQKKTAKGTKRGQSSRGTAHQSSPASALTPALCEDGSAPVRGSGGFACADGSQPGCISGSGPVSSPTGVPECESADDASAEGSATECEEEECQSEASCEQTSATGESPLDCEGSGGGEATS